MLVDLLLESARRRGRLPAVADARTSLTYDRLLKLALALRDAVTAATTNDKIGLLLPACPAFAGCLFGALWAGRKVVPLNFLLSDRELAGIVRTAGLDTIFTIRHFADLVARVPARAIFLEDLPIRRAIIWNTFRRTPPPPAVRPDDTAVILFTSGTAGTPKGVELTFANLVSNCRDSIATAGIRPDHRLLNCLPPFHVFGLTANVLLPVALGASVYCIPRFSPQDVVRAVAEQNISVLLAVPSMYNAVFRLKSAPADLFRRMFLLVSGGEPLPDPLAAGFSERFGVTLLQGYGLTETSPVCTLELPDARRPGSIGRPIRNVSARVVTPDGREAPTGADGEIHIKGPNVMKGYFADPAETGRVMTPDGWFKTGDGGRIDADGFVYITGRLKDMMIVAGENVYPREIEAVLERHPAVADVAVIGVPDSSRGEVPVAFVTCAEGMSATETELREFARQHLAGYKVPRSVRIERELPRAPTGKILKRNLRDLL